jgi:dihydrofolate reductase
VVLWGPSTGQRCVFVTNGIDDALARAQEAAAGKNATIMGGPTVGNQYMRAGLVDELSIQRLVG